MYIHRERERERERYRYTHTHTHLCVCACTIYVHICTETPTAYRQLSVGAIFRVPHHVKPAPAAKPPSAYRLMWSGDSLSTLTSAGEAHT